ncbi:MAG TPA: methylated-DNA--[protein]-cysteine S-methyltransferase [Solirubrobacteraceae bacterium]|jgi:methylated-DNA-[protein]-cysteine S-methyltransferase|nr:methylated-DNA--[protein]-cysteine S-methyltransferase [Solirubrobacteraceae bacterium]
MIYTTIDSPVGELLLAGDGARLSRLSFLGPGVRRPISPSPAWRRDPEPFAQVRQQLGEYFAGARQTFEIDLDLPGTEWERQVWDALLRIPYGATRSYGDIARELCTVRASRAVGLANGRNPVAIIVPCHRVIGADGRLTGFGGGLDRKRTLIDLEAGRLALTA